MKIVFLSNYYNHHQKQLSNELYRLTNGNYRFIETEAIEEERVNMGWGERALPAYVKQCYAANAKSFECQDILNRADCVIMGSAPEALLSNGKKANQLIFRYSERQLKKGLEPLKYPLRLLKFHKNNPKNSNMFLLCASAYAAADFARFGVYKNKAFKWGYFPETKKYADITGLVKLKKKSSILWAGRFLNWKHPDAAVRIAKRLKDSGYEFELNMIGTGAMEQELQSMIADFGLENEVQLLGAMKPEQVREHMEQSQIYLFTSDRNEGWGAVLNEAMNSGCAVVASHAIGAVPFLLKHRQNGLIYKDGNEEDLFQKVTQLLGNAQLCAGLGEQAYLTIANEWNAKIAAGRLMELAKAILSGNKKPELFQTGPCSKAEVLKDRWFL